MNRIFVSVFSLALLILNVACSSSEPVSREDEQAAAFIDLRSAVRNTVTDEVRRNQVLGKIDALERDVEDLHKLLVRRRAELRELNADYNATREDFVEFTSQMETRIRNGRREAIQRHSELASAMTAEEWASLSKAQTKAMRSISRSLQSI